MLHAQDSTTKITLPDTSRREDVIALTNCFPTFPNKTRIYLATAASVAAYTGTIVALSDAWYKNYARTPFHFFNDNDGWLQVDKAGHVFSAYTAGRMGKELWQWAGLSRKQRIWIGGLSGTAFLTTIEILDGFSSGWGFSIGDLSADLAGSGLFIAQELMWNEQRMQVKFSFHRNNYNDPSLDIRADQMFGHRTIERMLKDYNGQTYWLSFNLKSFYKKSNLPPWLNISIGYGADGMFGGTENISRDKNGVVLFDRSDVPRYRQWYLAPDIDFTKIRTKNKFLKATFFLLNSLKFPAPSIGFSKKGIEWNWLHF
jgi:uncharacterized protein YfiM (DUF2279 family)